MPQDRLLHAAAGHSDKVSQLTDFEARVWSMGYLLACDDFGVMRCSAVTVQAANDALAERPARDVEKALQRLIEVGLLQEFTHQGRRYVCQANWQDWQKVRYPRETTNPAPPEELTRAFSKATRDLFQKRAGQFPKDSGNGSETSQHYARAGTREWLTLTANANGTESPETLPQGVRLPTRPPRAAGRSDGVLAGALPKDHRNCAECSPDYAMCVPAPVHQKLRTALSRRFNGDLAPADAELRAWYPEVWKGLPADAVVGDAFRFWQAHFDAKFATKPEPIHAAKPVMRLHCVHEPRCQDDAAHTKRMSQERRAGAEA